MEMKRFLLAMVLTLMVLPLAAQDGGRTLKPNYRRIAKEIVKPDGPFFFDSLEARFDRCDTSLTVDDLRCLYYGSTGSMLYESFHRYWLLQSRFGRHTGPVNNAWTRYQMLLTAIWSTGDGSRRHPLHISGPDDASHFIASDAHGYMTTRWYQHRRYCLLQYVAHDEGDYDVWFYIRKR